MRCATVIKKLNIEHSNISSFSVLAHPAMIALPLPPQHRGRLLVAWDAVDGGAKRTDA
jgi:hypothetical protein